MEKKEKIEKPLWVEIVETLPEIIRQPVGNTCAGLISSLVQMYFIAPELYRALCDESSAMIKEYFEALEKRNNSPE